MWKQAEGPLASSRDGSSRRARGQRTAVGCQYRVYDGAILRAGERNAVLWIRRANLRCVLSAFTLAALGLGLLPPASSSAFPIQRWFWFQGPKGWTRAPLVLVAQGPDVRVFATDSHAASLRDANTLVASFERHILPNDLRLFGTPAHLGVVQILLVPLQPGILGYFDPTDLSPGSPAGLFNRGNFLYIRPASAMPDRPASIEVQEVVAHELCHLIQYRLRVLDHRLVPQATWLNEGLAFYAQLGMRYWTRRDAIKLAAAAATPSWPVDDLHSNDNFLRRHARVAYGRAGLFVNYLAGRYGPAFVRDLVVTRPAGLAGVAAALRGFDSTHTLSDVFADWGVAQQLCGHGRYGFSGVPVGERSPPRSAVPNITAYPWASRDSAAALSLAPFGQAYLRFLTNRIIDLRLSVRGPPGQVRAAVVLQDSEHVLVSRVRWLNFDSRGGGSIRIDGYGGLYDRLTLAISRVAPPGAAGGVARPVRVRADLWRDGGEATSDSVSETGHPGSGTNGRSGRAA